MAKPTSTLQSPQGTWWTPPGRDEKLWVAVVGTWAVAMFVMMVFIWPAIGNQHNEMESYRIHPQEFRALTDGFIEQYQIGDIDGVPLVPPPPGSDVYLEASRFQWRPVIQLQRGETYRLLISSVDVQHGFSLQPDNVNFQILPDYIVGLHMTPTETGEFTAVCNEYCGLGHHFMVGRIIVVE